jgi:hypothetical protein
VSEQERAALQHVTRKELEDALNVEREAREALEKRNASERSAFETRLTAQVKQFMAEMNGHIVRISNETHKGRNDLLDSNSMMVSEYKRVQERMDRGEEASNRHRESTAARLKAMEDGSYAVAEALQKLQSVAEKGYTCPLLKDKE